MEDFQYLPDFCYLLIIAADVIHEDVCQTNMLKSHYVTPLQNITDETVVRISDGCHGLLALCVTNCSHLTDASLVALGQGCTELRTLEVAGCSQFTDSGFQALARVCFKSFPLF